MEDPIDFLTKIKQFNLEINKKQILLEDNINNGNIKYEKLLKNNVNKNKIIGNKVHIYVNKKFIKLSKEIQKRNIEDKIALIIYGKTLSKCLGSKQNLPRNNIIIVVHTIFNIEITGFLQNMINHINHNNNSNINIIFETNL